MTVALEEHPHAQTGSPLPMPERQYDPSPAEQEAFYQQYILEQPGSERPYNSNPARPELASTKADEALAEWRLRWRGSGGARCWPGARRLRRARCAGQRRLSGPWSPAGSVPSATPACRSCGPWPPSGPALTRSTAKRHGGSSPASSSRAWAPEHTVAVADVLAYQPGIPRARGRGRPRLPAMDQRRRPPGAVGARQRGWR